MVKFNPYNYENYFGGRCTSRDEYGNANINGVDMVADYFMRIPSDAPKTFCITAPRYSIKGLLKANNTKQLNDNITDFINKVSNTKLDTTSYIGSFTNPITVRKDSKYLNGDDFYEHIIFYFTKRMEK